MVRNGQRRAGLENIRQEYPRPPEGDDDEGDGRHAVRGREEEEEEGGRGHLRRRSRRTAPTAAESEIVSAGGGSSGDARRGPRTAPCRFFLRLSDEPCVHVLLLGEPVAAR